MISPDSLHPPGIFRVVCRPVLPKDTPDVLELTRWIWGGHDYIHLVWADWLKDTEGLLAVAEYGGHVVGLYKLTRLSPSEWWLEGLRVHPDYEGRGIASRLHDYLMAYWERHRGGTIRLGTSSARKPVHHLSLRSGFRKIMELSFYAAENKPGPIGRVAPMQPGEENEALNFALHNPTPTFPNGLMDAGWQWVAPSADRIAQGITSGHAWWWNDDGGRQAIILARRDVEQGVEDLMVQLLVCPPELLATCLTDYRSLARSLGYQRVTWFVPHQAGLEPALEAADYRKEWEDSLFVYEKVASNQPNSP